MNYLVGGVLILLWGVFMCLKPSIFGGIFESWKNANNTTPSKIYLGIIRIGGCICMAIGLFVCVASFFIT